MKAALAVILTALLVAVSYPAYADDYLDSVNDLLDIWTDLRNDHLIETFFGESYATPEMAATETVNNAIEMYEMTRTTPQVQVTDRGTFVSHPLNPYGTHVVAFDAINSMRTTSEVYPFVIDAGTLEMLAEGAFPGTVGLYAAFLKDADRSLDIILQDLQDSDGTWVTYTFENPSIGASQVKHAWISLYDGYIFGSGYYESPDVRTVNTVESMVLMYDADGTGSFASLPAEHGASFVLDAETMDVISHTGEGIAGSAVKDAIAVIWHIDVLSEILSKHGSMWVSYESPEFPGTYVRAYLQLHDGHVFGSGQPITKESWAQAMVDEATYLYDLEGTDAFDIITTSTNYRGTLFVVSDLDFTVRAFAGVPQAVGERLDPVALDQDLDTLVGQLRVQPGLWIDSIDMTNPDITANLRASYWMILYDEYLFVTGYVYSPEERSIGIVNEAIEMYKTYGEEAFDRITWKSVRPDIVYPFVVDAQTWELKAHGAIPERVGVCCAAPIAASNDLAAATQALEQNPGIWLEYSFYNPIGDRYEHKRTYFSTYDGYTFAAGYYDANFERLLDAVQHAIDIYDSAEDEEAAFASITALTPVDDVYTAILDRETRALAYSNVTGIVGNVFDPYGTISSPLNHYLVNDGDHRILNLYVSAGSESLQATTYLFWLYDEYYFVVHAPFVFYTR